MYISRFKFDVEPLDYLLPEGVLRSSLIGIFGETGTGKSILLNEIAYRALKRGEKVLFILLEDTPASRLINFFSLGFDVTEYVKRGDLKFLDCFSYRLRERAIEVPEEVLRIIDGASGIVDVEDPRNLDVIWDQVERDAKAIKGRGLILIDSLTEFLTITPDPSSLLDMLKAMKAVVSKYYLVPIAYTFHFGFFDDFRYVLEVASDGVIDLRFNPELIKEMLVKQMRIRRMSGARHRPDWATFDVEPGKGLILLKK